MIACDTCNDEGRIRWMIESDPNCYVEADAEGMIPCPDCGDREFVIRAGREPLSWRLRSEWRRTRNALASAVRSWRRGNADVVAATITVHRDLLMDEPRLHAIIDRDLRRSLEHFRSYGWLRADLSWSLRNAVRALAGREVLDRPYDVVVTHEVVNEANAFMRNQTIILAEQRRRMR